MFRNLVVLVKESPACPVLRLEEYESQYDSHRPAKNQIASKKTLDTRSHATVYLRLPRIRCGIAGAGGEVGGDGMEGAAAIAPQAAPRKTPRAEH